MSSALPLLFIVLAVLAASFFYLVQTNGGIDKAGTYLEQYGIPVPWPNEQQPIAPEASPVSDIYTSGNSRFSQGRCTTSSECQSAGCSAEVCTSQGDVVTTCELLENHPATAGLTCQCVRGVCGWQ